MLFTRDELLSANPDGIADVLKDKHAFIAGAGGLGSNVATLLVRAGIGKVTVVDYDVIDPSNINRQQFFYDQIGESKVDALKLNLERTTPFVEVKAVNSKLTPDNFDEIIPSDCDIIFECFDNPVCKAELVRFCLSKRKNIHTVAVSGIAGSGDISTIVSKHICGKLYMVGDNESAVEDGLGTLSTRVMCAASLQAHIGINLLLK